MPDVRMPDGTIIRNVPEGTTRAQLMARYGKAKDSSSGMSLSDLVRGKQKPAPTKLGRGGFGYGLTDSVTLGFLDEIGSGLDAIMPNAVHRATYGENRPSIWNGDSLKDAYRGNLKRNRQLIKGIQEENPGEFLTGQIAGALTPLPGGKTKIAQSLNAAAKSKKAGAAGKVTRFAAAAAPDVARGAAYGVGSAEGGAKERLQGGAEGSAAGLGGHVAGRLIGGTAARVLKGKEVSKPVRELADADVVMTPGKRGGPVKRFWEEGVLGSVPFVREIPKAAQRRSVGQFNVAMINRALEPIGVKFPTKTPPGHELIQKAGDAAYSAYDASMDPLSLGSDSGLRGAANSIIRAAKATVGPNADQLNAIIAQTLAPLNKGPVKGSAVRDLLKDLRGKASNFKRSQNANEQNMGDELWKLHDHIDAALVRQNGKGKVAAFTKAREAIARFRRVEDAASKGKGGVFSPNMARQAATRRGYGMTTAKAARGQDPMHKLADAGAQVLPDILPSSGTTERAAGLAVAGGAAGGPGIAALLDPVAASAMGATTLPYVPGIDRLLQNLAINRPDLLIRLGIGAERITPALGTAGAMTSVGINSQP